MIIISATTIADAVRLANEHQACVDYWRNRLEDGPLKTALIRNQIHGEHARKDADAMARRVQFGRIEA